MTETDPSTRRIIETTATGTPGLVTTTTEAGPEPEKPVHMITEEEEDQSQSTTKDSVQNREIPPEGMITEIETPATDPETTTTTKGPGENLANPDKVGEAQETEMTAPLPLR